MSTRTTLISAGLALAACVSPAHAESSLSLDVGGGKLRVDAYADAIIRVRFTRSAEFRPGYGLSVVDRPWPAVEAQLEQGTDALRLTTRTLVVTVDRASGRVGFQTADGRPLLAERERHLEAVELGDGRPAWRVQQRFAVQHGEALYGLGQLQDGAMNWRGKSIVLKQVNTRVAVPMLLSTGGWGLLWNEASQTDFADAADGMSLTAGAADEEDYWFIAGNPDQVIGGYRWLTGPAPMFGAWAYGYWQSKEHYHTQQELQALAAEYRQRRIPIDNLVQDWLYWNYDEATKWTAPQWNSTEFDAARYPDPKAMMDDLHHRGIHLMISIWPKFGVGSRIHQEMKSRGYLLPQPAGEPAFYDPFNPKARDLFWSHLDRNLWSTGVDAWWMDASEPEMDPARFAQMDTFLGKGARVLNAFPLEHSRGVYEHQRASTERKRVFILSRSAFLGQQRNAAATWSGDITATWETLRRQIPAGLNFCMAGIPYWTTDIGGFFTSGQGFAGPPAPYADGCTDEAYRELYTRWFEFGAFCPIFRSHGTGTPREPWRFGEPGTPYYDAIIAYDRLRYRLLPYIYSLAWQVTSQGYTMMRGLAMDFAADPQVHAIGDQFMFGPALLVNPVLRPMYTRESVDPIPASNLFAPDGTNGLKAEYFTGTDLTAKVREATVSQVDFDWGTGSPTGLPNDRFSLRFTGQVQAGAGGTYTFVTLADDGVRLWIDGKLVIDDWTAHPATRKSAQVTLEANRRYDLKLEYFEAEVYATVKLGWITPTQQQMQVSKTRELYLPRAGWTDFWTGQSHAGGTTIEAPAPIGIMPLYVRAGSILPLGPAVQHAGERPADPLEIRIYPGADGAFTLYEDEGDGYAYERGVHATIDLRWDDSRRRLTIGARKGGFPGMLQKRDLRIVVVGPGHGAGPEPEAKPDQVVTYLGESATIDLP